MVTNYGSDISLFGKLAEHQEKIRSLLAISDFYACECERDIALAREYGFQQVAMPVLPSSGGFDLGSYTAFRSDKPVSRAPSDTLKGVSALGGPALVGLRALALCRDILEGYTIVISPALSDVALRQSYGRTILGSRWRYIRMVPRKIPSLMGEARVFIGLSISDGISHSLLEAMVRGAFPIQSCTACADEWIVDGESGFIVPPEDPQVVAEAIRRAVMDDALVDSAADRNGRVAAERLDRELLKPQIVALYERAVGRLIKEPDVKILILGGTGCWATGCGWT
jgi:glycosyltransferase involved in cell wall biosynthesis